MFKTSTTIALKLLVVRVEKKCITGTELPSVTEPRGCALSLLQERDHLKDLGRDRIMLHWIIKK
jgi:hypothetical protein